MANIPEGYHSVTPYIMVNGAEQALALYEKALGAEITGCIKVPDSDLVMHAMFKVGNSTVFIGDPIPNSDRQPPQGMSSAAFYVYVEDVDASYRQAVEGGMVSVSEPEDMFWGDRTAVLNDGFGYNWTLATFQREATPEEMETAMKQMATSSN